ncbi:MAG: hypothetical protein O3C30_04525 [Proteobacteria bacterium]|nr:hypothetical protein [Pseudomonadota bacterium]
MAASHPINGVPSKIISVTARNMIWLFVMAFIALAGASTPANAAKYAAIVIEEDSGRVLFARNADSLRYPASLTKIMTLYLLFEDIAAGRLTLKSRIKGRGWAVPVKIIFKTWPKHQRRTSHLCVGDKICQ